MKVVTFGEIMMRLSPMGDMRFLQSDSYDATFGGAEANVAVSLATLGVEAAFVSKIPDHDVGQAAINALRRYGVDTTGIARGGDKLGLYYCEKGAAQRAGKVIYDRAGSAIATAVPSDFAWAELLSGANWFHFTGITPALSEGLANICLTAVREAKNLGLIVSCDLNYRSKLWSVEKASAVMAEFCPYVDYMIVNEEHARRIFGIAPKPEQISTDGIPTQEGYLSIASQLTARYGFRGVAITQRETLSADDNRFFGMLYTDGKGYFSQKYTMHMVDRVGGGDGFAAGLIFALGSGYDPQKTTDFAAAASCLKHAIPGDFNLVSREEIENLAGATSPNGRMAR